MKYLLRVASFRVAQGFVVEALLFVLLCSFCVTPALAAKKISPPPPPPPPAQASLNYPSITSMYASPILSGTASNLRSPLQLSVINASGSQVYAGYAATTSGPWSKEVYPPIANGIYTVLLSTGTTTLYQGSLAIGASLPSLQPDFSLGAYDVSDGRLMRFSVQGGALGTQLGQLTFAITPSAATVDSVTLYGFTDPFFTEAIATGTDGSLGTTDVASTSPLAVIVPATPVAIPPQATYYFELDGAVTPEDIAYSITTMLMGDTQQGTGATLAAMASTSNFVWSPNSFGTTSPDDTDWLNASVIPGLSASGLTEERFSTPTLACDISVSTSTISAATPIIVSWDSSGADRATWSDGTTASLQGSATFVASSTRTFLLNFSGSLGSTQCFATVAFVKVPIQAPVSTTTPPVVSTSTPQGNFSVTPTSGVVPLTTTIRGTVNTNALCSAATYTLGYGDRSTTTISVAKNLCKSQVFTFSHRYATAGTYTVALYGGAFGGTTTPPLLQTGQVLVMSVKKASAAPTLVASVLDGFAALWSVLSAVLHHR